MQFVPLFYREARARCRSKTQQLRHMQDTDTGYEQGIFVVQFHPELQQAHKRQSPAEGIVSGGNCHFRIREFIFGRAARNTSLHHSACDEFSPLAPPARLF